ncbi:methylated-DNA--[protein]-cysteine S-methyltransferase [Lactobacillus reuteri]|uniref:methylated-DNA--[protein]-cysteine S-methyltransferase n=1 Tax=Limosilactobacillus reuteri TaxID=1598 RepID=A0A7X2G3K1_LIMRT|nr:methylated-DNA--[protein]-cysteine S-methyltransferase [Limosilactobacillus reuteri]MCC4397530.1 methylated-DNA--[protein]-cysteine S-methyltransferase [Limosilactobacillus reuteri]MCC4409446.1 methylated-DNA--[protein]-cysteine S-methyltransferase [Limosilactobacillus reuteri]MRH72034.1 methylated-DNA--[protein]-cysteine S-methyltransferase [Limosilactobacillus reuteri]MRH79973.1 methylated-DNA--[protein]-cysteine S-methyltransferase [Limosilactobacillus reuteri]
MKKTFYDSPLGKMTILADDQFLYGLWFNGQKNFGGHYNLDMIEQGTSESSQKTIEWLKRYFAGQNPSLGGLTLAPAMTPFQKKVYQALKRVPYGRTVTYKELSDAIQTEQPAKNLSRAVGNAIGRNQILLLLPCHRVVGSNGSLTGYAGGLERKKSLLKLEGALN